MRLPCYRLYFQFVPLRWWRCFQFVPPRWRRCFQIASPRWWRCFQFVPLRWWLCFQFVPLRCQIYFQTAPHNKTCWWKVESREFVFSIRKSIGKSIRKSDSTTRSVRPILWTQAAADAVHMYTSTAFSIYPPICTHCTSKSQPPYNHRTIFHAITAQASHAQCAAKVQAPRKYRTLKALTKCKRCASIVRSICRQIATTVQSSYNFTMQLLHKYRTLNLSPKRKHRANNTLFADFSAPFLEEFAFPSKFLLSA